MLYLSISINFRNRQDYYVRCEDTGIAGESGVLFLYVYSSYINVFIIQKCIEWHTSVFYTVLCVFFRLKTDGYKLSFLQNCAHFWRIWGRVLFPLIYIVDKIQFLEAVGPRSPFPCCLSSQGHL